MRDLTKWFYQNKPEETQAAAALLLSIDANVLAKGGVALAGGYLRDLYFGLQPKDMDFVFYGLTTQEFQAAFSMWANRQTGELTWEVFGEGDYNGADPIVPEVIKVTLDGREMDFILYDCPVLDGVMHNFDHSVNEFTMGYDEDFRLWVQHWGDWGICTRNANTTCTDNRVARMQELARQIDWEYVDA